MYIKGHLAFTLDGQDLEFIHRNISTFGVAGLPWGPLNSRDHFGKEVTASIRITQPEVFSVVTTAHIMRETTSVGENMALKFRLPPEAKARLQQLIDKHGFYPTEYLRKYPRIPANPAIQTFPLRALANQDVDFMEASDAFPLILDVCNLSPNGVLLSTENQAALVVQPGHKLNITLDPRGWFPMAIRVQGLVCRVSDEVNPNSGNMVRYLGIKFVKVDDINRTAFLDLLKDILGKMKAKT